MGVLMKKADMKIEGAMVCDGTGAPLFKADVAVVDDRIQAVGDLSAQPAGTVISGDGLVLAPGFIDVHTHDDRAVLIEPDHRCKVSQGVTTVVTGNCGVSLAPLKIDKDARPAAPIDLIAPTGAHLFDGFGDYLSALDNSPPAVNVLPQIGHSTVRAAVMDDLRRAATDKEVSAMRKLVDESLAAGAPGFSTGLFYRPAELALTEEVIALVDAVGDAGGFHSTHMRDEGDGVITSIEETARIGREGGAPVVISHHKCTGHENFGRSVETLARIDHYRTQQPISMDVYPYDAGSTVLDPGRLDNARKILVAWSEPRPELAGRDLDELAAELGLDRVETVKLISPAGGIFFMMDEEDVRRILAHPAAMIGSDGLPHDANPHPRLWGSFPRVLGHYSRDEGLFPLEEAVRKMTGLSAQRFGLKDRGVIRPGAFADIVLFDADTIIDRATYDEPDLPAEGIEMVIVNGRVVWRDGDSTGARSGRAIRLDEITPYAMPDAMPH